VLVNTAGDATACVVDVGTGAADGTEAIAGTTTGTSEPLSVDIATCDELLKELAACNVERVFYVPVFGDTDDCTILALDTVAKLSEVMGTIAGPGPEAIEELEITLPGITMVEDVEPPDEDRP